MDKDFQTSFIPKKPLAEDRVARSRPVSLFVFIATLIFFGSLVAAGGTYFYRLSLGKKIASMNADLVRARDAFEPGLIEDLQTLDRRINAGSEILKNHVSVTPIFTALEQITLKSVQFTRFDYSRDSSSDASLVNVKMSGRARDYTSIALESNRFGTNKYFKDPIFSNLALDDRSGAVTFDLAFSVDSSFVSFEENLQKGGGASTPPAAAGPAAGPAISQ